MDRNSHYYGSGLPNSQYFDNQNYPISYQNSQNSQNSIGNPENSQLPPGFQRPYFNPNFQQNYPPSQNYFNHDVYNYGYNNQPGENFGTPYPNNYGPIRGEQYFSQNQSTRSNFGSAPIDLESGAVDEDVIIPESDKEDEMEDVVVTTTKGKGKGKVKGKEKAPPAPPYVFDRDLEIVLSKSFIEISENPIVGNAQKKKSFWSRITEDFNMRKPGYAPSMMGVRTARTKFQKISADVNLFVGCVSEMDDQRQSGADDSQQLEAAKKMFKSRHTQNKNFTYEGCWQVLRGHRKWEEYVKKCNRSNNQSTDIGEDGDIASEAHSAIRQRPQGIKAAKAALKGKQKGKSAANPIDVDRIEKMHQEKINQNNDLMKQKDMDTLMRNTAGFTAAQLRDYESYCASIRAKYPEIFDGPPDLNHPANAPYG